VIFSAPLLKARELTTLLPLVNSGMVFRYIEQQSRRRNWQEQIPSAASIETRIEHRAAAVDRGKRYFVEFWRSIPTIKLDSSRESP